MLDYIDAHLAEGITAADLANVARFSVFHFTRAFSAAIGTPPQRYVRRRRFERAKALIAVASTSIARAAFMCGFSSQASFTRAFRKATGMTPAAYRRAFGSQPKRLVELDRTVERNLLPLSDPRNVPASDASEL